MFVVRGTKKFLDRVPTGLGDAKAPSTTALGDWYATVLFWRPQVALFVNESTLLPVLAPLAPTVTVLERFPAALGAVLRRLGIEATFVARELAEMWDATLAKTQSRSVVGVMNELARLAAFERDATGTDDLTAMSCRLAETPCGPLYNRHVSPDRELDALVARLAG